jgi:hypothetical protein
MADAALDRCTRWRRCRFRRQAQMFEAFYFDYLNIYDELATAISLRVS